VTAPGAQLMLDVAQAGRFASQTEFRGLTGTMVRAGMEGVAGFESAGQPRLLSRTSEGVPQASCDCPEITAYLADSATLKSELLSMCEYEDDEPSGDVYTTVIGEPFYCERRMQAFTCCTNPAEQLMEDGLAEKAFESALGAEAVPNGDCVKVPSRQSDQCGAYAYSYGKGGEADCGCVGESSEYFATNPIQVGFLWTYARWGWRRDDLKNFADADELEESLGLTLGSYGSEGNPYEWGCDQGTGAITTAQAKAVYQEVLRQAWRAVVANADLVESAVCQVLGSESSKRLRSWFQSGVPLRVLVASDPKSKDDFLKGGEVLDGSSIVLINCDGDPSLKSLVVAANGDPEQVGKGTFDGCWIASFSELLVHELVHVLFGEPDSKVDLGPDYCGSAYRVQRLWRFLMEQRAPGWAGPCLSSPL
jgi:hypothetical protein